ncbi:Hypothetical predicted protein [Mytilus galloprovincialis]|uniref:Uncharacterized protein n=1 Tax=Mytilus galloprovincialis TaxID=29158 RepID=A0A8B6EW42_MYTGA|nr:Hypothetical predicted protein [Mytilus galloprovincialis]
MDQITQTTETVNSLTNAPKACPDNIAKFWKTTTGDLQALGMHLDDPITVTFGIKKFPVIDTKISNPVQAAANNLGGGHHAVILKLEDKDKCAFKLELIVDEDVCSVKKNFKCPNEECNFQTSFFSKLTNHHFLEHVGPEGENIHYECCGHAFRNFQSYCQHQYTNHSTKGEIQLKFDHIRENNFENFLDHVQYFGAYKKSTTLRQVMQCAVDIILNFGRYWVYCWNCQDFATWFLVLVGVPLRNVDPTLADKLTGSGTKVNARSIQQSKESYLYKTHNELEMHDLTDWKGGTICDESECKFLPPMSLEALIRHTKVAHNGDTISGSSMDDIFDDFLYTVSGSHMDINLDVKVKRKYSLYQLRGTDVCSHTSIVFSPWTSSIESNIHKYDFYHTAEMVIDGTKRKPLVRPITEERHVENLRYICDIDISTEELLDYMNVIYKITFKYSSDESCMAFFVNLLAALRYFRERKIVVSSVNEGLLAEYENYRRLTDIKKRRNALLKIIEFFSLNQEFQGEIQVWKSSFIYDFPKCSTKTSSEKLKVYANAIKHLTATKFNEMQRSGREKWVSLHPLISMFLMSFNTIGELFLPMYFVFTVLLILSFGLPLLPKKDMNGLKLCLQYIRQPHEWLNIPAIVRNLMLIISLIVLAYEAVKDDSVLMSAFIMQYLWIICITLEEDIYKRVLTFHEMTLKNVPKRIVQLIHLGIRNNLFRFPVAVVLVIPLSSCPYVICCLSILIIIICSLRKVGEYLFTGGLPISLFTCQYVRIINHCIVCLYMLAIASIGIQGVIRIPVFQFSNYHCFAIYIYTSLSWYRPQKNNLIICRNMATTYNTAVERDIIKSHEKELLSSWLSIFHSSVLFSMLTLHAICLVPVICVCIFDVHICLCITFITLYLHCLLLYFTIDLRYVIKELFSGPLEKYILLNETDKTKIP